MSPSWFSITMGTGIPCTLIFSSPYPMVVERLKPVSTAIGILNTILFCAFTAAFVARYIRWPHIVRLTLGHPLHVRSVLGDQLPVLRLTDRCPLPLRAVTLSRHLADEFLNVHFGYYLHLAGLRSRRVLAVGHVVLLVDNCEPARLAMVVTSRREADSLVTCFCWSRSRSAPCLLSLCLSRLCKSEMAPCVVKVSHLRSYLLHYLAQRTVTYLKASRRLCCCPWCRSSHVSGLVRHVNFNQCS